MIPYHVIELTCPEGHKISRGELVIYPGQRYQAQCEQCGDWVTVAYEDVVDVMGALKDLLLEMREDLT